jgi:hypothetical protein
MQIFKSDNRSASCAKKRYGFPKRQQFIREKEKEREEKPLENTRCQDGHWRSQLRRKRLFHSQFAAFNAIDTQHQFLGFGLAFIH